jgi:hypothetical protein
MKSSLAAATAFLEGLLEDGPVTASEALVRAEAAGISERSLRRAKASLGVASKPEGTLWTWLPVTDAKTADTDTPLEIAESAEPNSGSFGEAVSPSPTKRPEREERLATFEQRRQGLLSVLQRSRGVP